MTEYFKFIGQFLGGVVLLFLGLGILIWQIKESKKDGALTDEYGNRIEMYVGAIIFMILGLAIFIRVL